mgnify:CR=1 FL=1
MQLSGIHLKVWIAFRVFFCHPAPAMGGNNHQNTQLVSHWGFFFEPKYDFQSDAFCLTLLFQFNSQRVARQIPQIDSLKA